MSSSYVERLELGDGQWAELLTRLPADRAQAVRVALAREQDARKKSLRGDDPVFTEAVMRAHLLTCSVTDYLTGQPTSDIGKADPRILDQVQVRAFVLYVEWSSEAYPKAGAATAPTNGETPTSDASPQSEA